MSEMKKKRHVVGNVVKSKDDPKSSYISLSHYAKDALVDALSRVEKGKPLNLSLENKAKRLAQLKTAVEADKLSADLAEKIQTEIEEMPEWVLFQIVLYSAFDLKKQAA